MWRSLRDRLGLWWGVEPELPPRPRLAATPTLDADAAEVMFFLLAAQREFDARLKGFKSLTGFDAARVEDRRGCSWWVGSESTLSSVSEWVWYESEGRLLYVGGYRRVEWGEYTLVADTPFNATVYLFRTRDRKPSAAPRPPGR